jgi:hypothetical protein
MLVKQVKSASYGIQADAGKLCQLLVRDLFAWYAFHNAQTLFPYKLVEICSMDRLFDDRQ